MERDRNNRRSGKVKPNVRDIYAIKHGIEDKRFWWEGLPIIRHLATKRLASKMKDVRLDLLLEALGYETAHSVDKKGDIHLVRAKKSGGKNKSLSNKRR